MAYMAKQSEKREYPRPNDGEYAAICYRFLDLGTSKNKHGNMQPSIILGWELHGDNLTGEGSAYIPDGEHKGKPFVASNFFNPSFGSPDKHSNFRKFLEGWRGRAFTQEELEGFDVMKLLGVPCRLTLKTDPESGYQNVVDAKPMIKGMAVPTQVNSNSIFLLPRAGSDVRFEEAAYEKLPEFIRKKIASSTEFKAMNGVAEEPAPTTNPGAPFDDEIPF